MQIGPGIYRLGEGIANAYLLEESGFVTIVDASAPGYYRDLPTELESIGLGLASVKAVLLTHAHSDHLGFAERIRRERSVPVWVHEADAALARGETKALRDPTAPRRMRIRPLASFLWWGLRHGALRVPPVKVVSTFGDGATLDLPGSPRVILVPGHTAGSAALWAPSHDAVFVGDALATLNVMSGAVGPQLAPFGADLRQALASLSRLERVDARRVLPGHGQPWTGGLPDALTIIREAGPTLR